MGPSASAPRMPPAILPIHFMAMGAYRARRCRSRKGPVYYQGMSAPTVYRTALRGLERIHEGKVRDIYAVDGQTMLIVTTDRLSAFDVVLPDPIPGKGRVINRISHFWFGRTRHLAPTHLTGRDPGEVVRDADERALLEGRAVIVRRLQALPL